MAGLGNFFQKAVYLGIGLASYTGEKAAEKAAELRSQAQRLADELVQRGELTAEEARRLVDDMIQQSQQANQQAVADAAPPDSAPKQPRQIEISDEDEEAETPAGQDLQTLRQQVEELQQQLKRLQDP